MILEGETFYPKESFHQPAQVYRYLRTHLNASMPAYISTS